VPDVEERLEIVEIAVGTYDAKSGPDEGPLRSDVVPSRVGDHPRQPVVFGDRQYGNDRLGGIAIATGRRDQAVTDLDATLLWLGLEADPPDGTSIGQAGDPVEAERSLLSARGGGAKEAPDCPNVALEGEIIRPSIFRPSTSSDDPLSLRDIDRVKLEARCSNVSHGGQLSSPNQRAPPSSPRSLALRDAHALNWQVIKDMTPASPG